MLKTWRHKYKASINNIRLQLRGFVLHDVLVWGRPLHASRDYFPGLHRGWGASPQAPPYHISSIRLFTISSLIIRCFFFLVLTILRVWGHHIQERYLQVYVYSWRPIQHLRKNYLSYLRNQCQRKDVRRKETITCFREWYNISKIRSLVLIMTPEINFNIILLSPNHSFVEGYLSEFWKYSSPPL
jgi:hypothetical protein